MAVDIGVINDHVKDNQTILIDIYAMEMFNYDNTHLPRQRPRWVDQPIHRRMQYRKMAIDLIQEAYK